ncbi:MAG TPA: SCO family protein [Stellaceae bacterium]|jgi:protein SCO1/2|nr:SCO family protein [Stellaceae bacterium]
MPGLSRRRAAVLLSAGASVALLGGCGNDAKWNTINVAGTSPSLRFSMARAPDGKEVTAADYRGSIVMLYFGYTYCPDVCPTTLSNLAEILQRIGSDARQVRVLFVTVDPDRDTLPVLATYVKNFGAEFEGLRGTPDQLAALAQRYRVVYSVTKPTKDHPYEVTHSSAIYVFDGTGAARLLVPSLATTTPDITGTAADLKRLVAATNPPGLLARLLALV